MRRAREPGALPANDVRLVRRRHAVRRREDRRAQRAAPRGLGRRQNRPRVSAASAAPAARLAESDAPRSRKSRRAAIGGVVAVAASGAGMMRPAIASIAACDSQRSASAALRREPEQVLLERHRASMRPAICTHTLRQICNELGIGDAVINGAAFAPAAHHAGLVHQARGGATRWSASRPLPRRSRIPTARPGRSHAGSASRVGSDSRLK